jgi:triosephosphate isomerase
MPMPMPVLVGVSLKMYFGHREALDWLRRAIALAAAHPGVRSGDVRFFVIPGYVTIVPALDEASGTPVLVGAQDVAAEEPGPYTGEVSAAELAEVGVRLAEIGHAERRLLFGDDDAAVAAKTAIALRHRITPVLCVGESEPLGVAAAIDATRAQVAAALAGAPRGAVVLAYEPVWAIGAAAPAPDEHIRAVCAALRETLAGDPARSGSAVIYGGSAGPGLLARLGDDVDGLFLGRFAHDPAALVAVLDEALALASARAETAG